MLTECRLLGTVHFLRSAQDACMLNQTSIRAKQQRKGRFDMSAIVPLCMCRHDLGTQQRCELKDVQLCLTLTNASGQRQGLQRLLCRTARIRMAAPDQNTQESIFTALVASHLHTVQSAEALAAIVPAMAKATAALSAIAVGPKDTQSTCEAGCAVERSLLHLTASIAAGMAQYCQPMGQQGVCHVQRCQPCFVLACLHACSCR